MNDSIEIISMVVEIQANGIIRNASGRLIGRLVDDIDFYGEHIKKSDCLFDNLPEDMKGKPMMLHCPCKKCSPIC